MRAIAGVVALTIVSACTFTPSVTTTPSALATPSVVAATPSIVASPAAASPAGLVTAPVPTKNLGRRWYTVPDGLSRDQVLIGLEMPPDSAAGQPRARLKATGQVVDLAQGGKAQEQWTATFALDGLAPGEHTVEFLVRLRDGSDKIVATSTFMLSQPIYVVWTLDFEGDAATNETMDNAYLINRTYFAPMTIMWNPRVWTANDVPASRAEVMRQWTLNIANAGQAEVALHIHAWTDFVRASGVTPRTTPSWAGRGDGYDVPLTAFDQAETAKLLDYALRLMSEHGMPRPTSFRAGGLFANAANLRAIAAAGFTADTSATPAGTFGALTLPWTLPKDAQPYQPSRTDANASGDLPLLEVPNNAGNTYGLTSFSIQRVVNDDLAMLPAVGAPSAVRRALTLVSHPATIDATERAAIEKLFEAFEPYRWDRDKGPLRFVTLAQLAKAYAR